MSICVDGSKLRKYVAEIFEKAGLSKEDAFLVSDNLVSAEERGVRSHGLVQVSHYLPRCQQGLTNIHPHVRIIKEDTATLLIEGDHGPGASVGTFAMKKTIQKAREAGSCVTAVRNSTHFGMAAYFARMALPEDMIGLAFTNVREPLVAPFGGYRRELGTNPVCIAVPAKEHKPVIFDAATSEAAYNKLIYAQAEQLSIPSGWAVDRQGRFTTDPTEAIEHGALVPFGAYKGYGLAVAVNLITAILSGAALSFDEEGTITEDITGVGFCFAAIDIARFIDPEQFKILCDRMISRLKESPRAEGTAEILVPGEPEDRLAEEAALHGLLILDGVEKQLRDAGETLQTAMSLDECLFV